jgi:hypothetical protein
MELPGFLQDERYGWGDEVDESTDNVESDEEQTNDRHPAEKWATRILAFIIFGPYLIFTILSASAGSTVGLLGFLVGGLIGAYIIFKLLNWILMKKILRKILS